MRNNIGFCLLSKKFFIFQIMRQLGEGTSLVATISSFRCPWAFPHELPTITEKRGDRGYQSWGYQGQRPISANFRLDHLLIRGPPVGHLAPRRGKRQERKDRQEEGFSC